MKYVEMKIKAYEFCTPKFGGNVQYENYYDYEIIEKLFYTILKLNKPERKYADDSVSINLGDFKESRNEKVVVGHFITARHGKRQTHIDIDTQEEIGKIERHHGVENEVYFMIDRKTGLLLVQDDYNKVFNRKLLFKLLHLHKHLIYPYIDKYNEINKKTNRNIHKRSCYRLLTLPPVDFLESLRSFKKIKTATLTLDYETEKRKIDVSSALDKELEDNNIENYDLEIKIKNKSGASMVKTFENYFSTIIEQQKYDSYAIEGELNNGKTKVISPDTVTKDFHVKIKANSIGEFSEDEIFNEMQNIINNDNPIKSKGPTQNSILVGECSDVEDQIDKLILDKIQNQKSEEKESS